MLTKVDVSSALGGLLSLTLDDVSDGLILEEIRGLDPVKATLTFSKSSNFDGGTFQSSSRENRNLVFTIGLEPDYATSSVQDLRRQLYAYFMPESSVSMKFFVDDQELVIQGVVESCESAHFSKEPQVVVSIICFNPDFVDQDAIEIEGDTVEDSTEFVVEYDGNVSTGFTLALELNRSLSEFTIYNRAGDGVTRSLDFSASLDDGDVLTISTIPGQKGATLLRAAVESSLLYGVSPQATWLELYPGENNLRVYAVGAAIPFTLTYTNKYGGI